MKPVHPELVEGLPQIAEARRLSSPHPRYNIPAMSRLILTLLATLTLALIIACANNEDIPSGHAIDPSPSASPNTIGDAITICGQIGVPGEATASSPTSEPSCEPGDDFTAPPGVTATISDPPPFPSGTEAVTSYIQFTFNQADISGIVGLPPRYTDADGIIIVSRSVAWYTYASAQWIRLDATVNAIQSSMGTDGLYSSYFDPIPANLILLAEP